MSMNSERKIEEYFKRKREKEDMEKRNPLLKKIKKKQKLGRRKRINNDNYK